MEEEVHRKKSGLLHMLAKEHRQGDVVEQSAIYECSYCEGITAFKRGEKFSACPDCKDKRVDQGWFRTDDFVHFVSKNLNTEFDKIETASVRVAEFIAEFSGNVWFVYFHVVWFVFWIWVNTGHPVLGFVDFDPYPFGLLTMVVSLEAIFLGTFILIAQNLQARKSELRAELDYQVNLKTEKDVAEMLSVLTDIREGRLRMTKDGRVILETEGMAHAPQPRSRRRGGKD